MSTTTRKSMVKKPTIQMLKNNLKINSPNHTHEKSMMKYYIENFSKINNNKDKFP